MSNTPKTWFITGASRGLGAQWAEAALSRGDRVAAAARSAGTLDSLAENYGDLALPLELDVTDEAAVHRAVAAAEERFGGIDILVNNAGQAVMGAVEEVTAAQAREQMEVNYFGAFYTSQAVVPHMRNRRSGRIIQISSMGGVVALPTMGTYHATKWALEALSQALAAEVAEYGVHVTLVEPLMFPSELGNMAPQMPEYDHARALVMAGFEDTGIAPGDPAAAGRAMLTLADDPNPPLRTLFGANGLPLIRPEYARRIALWEEWDHLAQLAQGTSPA
ncbi:SDR family NAD(P)-dependent oxidoreductase [Planotetraspora kaengkrachanensis]|uniref:Short-chain dehydrogenase/reductase n=1 Tax=Planotetraspora kaengkrachanensis TaxID=575193 RepID=A0A8J3Q0K9_9ACTN|nr:SDR family NAD(P)-dependent oxidoreductase [Planotetraspora kaengkrachanensis]GIG84306.1 short-chain dehydrogenase/reductase [Planotetraspora kaengkrachanensis]